MRQGRGRGIRLAAAYYLIAGLIGTALGAYYGLSLAQAILGDYGHSLQDFLVPIVGSLVGVTLLPSARRLRRDPPQLGLLVGAGVVVGLAVAALPIVLILWVADLFGSFNVFGSEIPTVRLVLPFVGPLLWAIASAVAIWRQATREERRALVMGLGAASLITVLVPLLIGLVGGIAAASRPVITESLGTMTLRLEGPIDLFHSGEAQCAVDASGEQLSVSREPDPDLQDPDERFSLTTATVTARDRSASGREPRDDGLELLIMIGNPYADDEEARGAHLVSTQNSVLEGGWDGASGSLRFARLAARPYGGGPPEDTIEWEGTVEWTCPNM